MRNAVRVLAMVGTTGALIMAVAANGCGSSRKSGNNDQGGGGAAAASQLNVAIQSADVPASGNPTITFRLTDAAGTPIDDLATEIANDAASGTKPTPRMTPHFTLAQLDPNGTYTNYYEVTVNAAAYTDAAGQSQSPTGSAVQPRTEPPGGPFPVAQLQAKGNGVYTYTFSAPTTDAAKRNRALTHSVGFYATRTVSTTPFGATAARDVGFPASATSNFVPGGGAPGKIETVNDQACNTCHSVLEAHDRRRGTQLCLTCHGGSPSNPYADAETKNSIDFRAMIHQIHSGQSGYHIVGFRQADQDFSDVGFPQSIRNCTACHAAGAANADNWKTKANLPACASCHSNVRFDSSAGAACGLSHVESAPCNHVAANATADCATCHAAGGSLGPDKVHVDPVVAASPTFKFQITNVTVGADRKPVVQFQVLKDGTAQALTEDPWIHGANSRLFVDIGWPSSEYDNAGSGAADGQPVQINALPPSATGGTATPVAGGAANTYQVASTVAIPAGVNDVTVTLEGHPAIPDPYNAGGFLRVPVVNDVRYTTAAGGAGAARRQVVAVENCNACHQLLNAHGQNRTGTTQVCAVCHNPSATDRARVPAGQPVEPIDFKVLVHQIHADKIRQTPVVIFGFGGSRNTFPLGFPGDVGNCNLCHVNNSFQLPLAAGVHDTTIPAGGTTPKTIAVCASCHDQVRFDGTGAAACGPAVTGPCNHTGGPQTGDTSCASCHGPAGPADVARVHPVRTTGG